jgi:hypothetical protein
LTATRLAAAGLFVLVTALYAAAGPGRIDIIDGQYRFEVARNILEDASVQLRDQALGDAVPGLIGAYSSYGISGSLVALPMVALAKAWGPPSVDREQFFFSFTSAILGAGSAAILFLFYVRLGVTAKAAAAWTFVAAFTTLSFPASATVFDQAQQGFFVIAACYFGWLSARHDSMKFAAVAGAALAVLVNFQESYAVLLPGLALAAWGAPGTAVERKRALERCAVVVFVGGAGLLFYAGFNNFRYGSLVFSGKGVNHPSPLGNPIVGAAGLLFSPGKSIFLYSVPTALSLAGLFGLARLDRNLARAVTATSLTFFALIATLSFYGGDWCWGPRYFATILPLVGLGFPFVRLRGALRALAVAAIAAGFAVQLLALSLDHHRFFYARSLPRFFWYTNQGFYFHESALFARPGEILESLRDGVPETATAFRPGPYPQELTYAVFGMWGRPDLPPPIWMRGYSVFWLPRPWPLWMRTIPREQLPVNPDAVLGVLAAAALLGAGAMAAGIRRSREEAHVAA